MATGPGGAQSLRNPPVPAEFPPESYTGTQYVDSAGCVFIRAGVGAVETWVPRLTRSRQPLCGFTPSLARSTPDAAPAQQTQRTAAAPRPAPRAKSSQPQPAAAPRSTSAPRSASARAPERVTATATPTPARRPVATPDTAARPARRITPPDPGRSACAGLSGVSAAYTVQHTGSPVRCGPQRAHYITYAQGGGAAASPPPGTRATPDSVPPGTRVAPARVYASQKASTAGISVPDGMKPVWEDDRLNPHRAHQTFAGKARMELMWTNTVPRRLIDRRSGGDVIHKYPGLRPPYTSFEDQRAAGVTVATRGSYVPDPVTTGEVRGRARSTGARPASVSTRSAPKVANAAAGPAPQEPGQQEPGQTAHYAQAGLFADAARGLAAARRITGAGLPARRGTLHRDGRALTLVLAGPFPTEAEAREGAARLRGMGFSDVRLR
ncbi:SPOR domain-containing protein [Roseovarius ramblicola]|uniref:SPOR domain-containing protein n=1 Tax=Roseovarius ramblicola TaxID=2022336 RepID=A0ABV5HZ35_9RHOB